MPIKLRKSHTIRDKNTGKMKQEHSYMKMANLKELKELLEMPNIGQKVKQKIKNELERRKKIGA
jgi:hypothetical protein